MLKFMIGLLIVLHGLVHLWYVVLSRRLVPIQPAMGWTGRSWLFTSLIGDASTRWLASGLYALAAVALVAGGIGYLARSHWAPPVLLGAAVLSAATIVLFWDGSVLRIVEKGLIGLLISLALAGTVAGTARYRSDMAAAQARLASLGSQVIETECGPIEYADVGEGYPVLVVHANGGGFDQGLGLAEGFLDGSYRIIAPSRFGYLRTPVPEGASPALQADALACLLDAMDVAQAAVVTMSAGATSSLELARRHPERVLALVLASPNPPGEVTHALPPRPIFSAMVRSDFAFWAMTRYLQPTMRTMVLGVPKGLTLTPQMETQVQEALAASLPVSPRANGVIFDTFTGNPAINDIPLETIETPALVVSAVDDTMALHAGARALAERLPNARLLAVPDGGHLMLGHNTEVQQAITQHLRDTLTQAASSR